MSKTKGLSGKQDHRLTAQIWCMGKHVGSIPAASYWQIVDCLRTFGAERQAAYDAARWCARAKEELDKKIGDITIILEVEDG